ncbi:DUF7236 family protein [Streptomyces sp. CoH17]|uniref:DUF7236 family protein n=1 Tax=Streptomyces sp. CoH17 TaxID=2992806 RepID=UPI00226FE32E|nr:hypothetical protein [Streptomyces sp. CoH17]
MKRVDENRWVTYSDKAKYTILLEDEVYRVSLTESGKLLEECSTYREAIRAIERFQIDDVEVARLTSDRPQTGRVKHGVDRELEWGADILLAHDRVGKRRTKSETDYLSPTQLQRRQGKEVYPTAGVPEAKIFGGLYKRVYAPPRSGSPRELTGKASSVEEA